MTEPLASRSHSPSRNPSFPQIEGPSRRSSHLSVKALPNSKPPRFSPGLSYHKDKSNLRIVQLELAAPAGNPTAKPGHHGLGSIPQLRDMAILLALDAHRYLDRFQLQALFFSGPRSCQYRLRWLINHRLVHAWTRVERPGRICHASVYFLSRYGASALAEWIGDDPNSYMRRAEHAMGRRFHILHRLEANQFFVNLTAVTAPHPDLGLYNWVGEQAVRDVYADSDERGPIPDGWGRLLTADRELLLHLEWDRGTEQLKRLRGKLRSYTDYFMGRPGASNNHVLLVLPNDIRERQVLRMLQDTDTTRRECCRFWTATAAQVAAHGPLADIWASGHDNGRVGPLSMSGQPRSTRLIADSIGKPGWWQRRPGGGAGA